MSKILWRKDYDIRCEKGHFKMFVSSHESGDFFSSVMYYDKIGSFKDNQDVEMNIQFKIFIGNSEESVFSQCKDWVLYNIDDRAFIVELKNQIR